jgi:hypothetical protein
VNVLRWARDEDYNSIMTSEFDENLEDALINARRLYGFKLPTARVSAPLTSVAEFSGYVCDYSRTVADPPECASFRHFGDVCRAIHAVTGVPVAELRPETALLDLFPCEERTRCWHALGKTLRLPLPDATFLPGGGVYLIILTALNAWLVSGSVLSAWQSAGVGRLLFSLLGGHMLAIATLVLLGRILRPVLPMRIPPHLSTVADITAFSVLCRHGREDPRHLWPRGDLRLAVRFVVAEAAETSIRKIHFRTTFKEAASLR